MTLLCLAFGLLATPCAPMLVQSDPRSPAHDCCDRTSHQQDRKSAGCELCCVAPAVAANVAQATKCCEVKLAAPFYSSPFPANPSFGGQPCASDTHPPGSNRLPLYLANAALLV